MSDIITDRLEPLASIREPVEQRQRETDPRQRRRPAPPAAGPPESGDAGADVGTGDTDDPPHQVDDMA